MTTEKYRIDALETNSSSAHALVVRGKPFNVQASDLGEVKEGILYIPAESDMLIPVKKISLRLRKPLLVRFCEKMGLNGLVAKGVMSLSRNGDAWVYNQQSEIPEETPNSMSFELLSRACFDDKGVLEVYTDLMLSNVNVVGFQTDDPVLSDDAFNLNYASYLKFWLTEIQQSFNLDVDGLGKLIGQVFEGECEPNLPSFRNLYQNIVLDNNANVYCSWCFDVIREFSDALVFQKRGDDIREWWEQNYLIQDVLDMGFDEFYDRLQEIYLLPNNPFKVVDMQYLG